MWTFTKYIALSFLLFLIMPNEINAQAGDTSSCNSQKTQIDICKYWRSKIDYKMKFLSDPTLDNFSPENVTKAIDCLLKLEGKKGRARFGGAVSLEVSVIFAPSSIEVGALYYISYLYYQKWEHAMAVALIDEDGNVNSSKVIKKAYSMYKKWFKKIEEIGLEKARKQKLDPLGGTDVRWY